MGAGPRGAAPRLAPRQLRCVARARGLPPDIKLRVVIDVEQNRKLSHVLNALNPKLAQSVINARQEGTTTALTIKEALDEKSLVTLLADRARPGNQVMTADFLGRPAPFPTAPWQLAAALKVPVVLCFGLYRGGNRYDLYFETFADTLKLERTQREQHLRQTIRALRRPGGALRTRRADNWFNFYDFWRTDDCTTHGAAGSRAAARDGGGARR